MNSMQVNHVCKEEKTCPMAGEQELDKQIPKEVLMPEARALATPRGHLVDTPEILTDTRLDAPAVARPDTPAPIRPDASVTRPDASILGTPEVMKVAKSGAPTCSCYGQCTCRRLIPKRSTTLRC